MSRYRRMRRGRVTQVQGTASRGEDFLLMNGVPVLRHLGIFAGTSSEAQGMSANKG